MNRREHLTNKDLDTNDPQKKYTARKNILLEGLNKVHGVPTSPLVQIWIKTHICLVCIKKNPKLSMHHLLEHKNQDIKRRLTQQYIKIVSEYDQEIPQSQIADKPMAPRGRATQ